MKQKMVKRVFRYVNLDSHRAEYIMQEDSA